MAGIWICHLYGVLVLAAGHYDLILVFKSLDFIHLCLSMFVLLSVIVSVCGSVIIIFSKCK